MNNKYNSELIARILLMAYTDPGFSQENGDLILNLAKAYYDVCQKEMTNNMIEDAKKAYSTAVRKLDQYRFSDLRISHLDDVRMIREVFYPPEKICANSNGEINKMINFYISKIFEIASCFITFRDGRVSIKYTVDDKYDDVFGEFQVMNKIELWNTISRIMPCDIFIVAHYVNCGITSESDIYNYFVNVPTIVDMCDVPVKNIFSRGIAETHMHMKAGISYLDLWKLETNIKLSDTDKNDIESEKLFNGAFRFIFANFLENNDGRSFKEYVKSMSNESAIAAIVYKEGFGYDIKITPKISLKDEIYTIYRYTENENYSEDLLEETVYSKYNKTGTDGELIFLYKCLTYFCVTLRNDNGYHSKRLFIKYIRNKSSFFSDKLLSNKIQGLDYFKDFYHNATDFGKYKNISKVLLHEIAVFREQCKNAYLKKLELKRAPKLPEIDSINDIVLEQMEKNIILDVYNILSAYVRYIDNYRPNSSDDIPSIGIVYHFLKFFDTDNFNGHTCVVVDKNMPLNFKYKNYYSIRELYSYFIKALNNVLIRYPFLSKYIVGIDAASSEHAMEPWVLAPVFKNARSRETTRPVNAKSKEYIANIGFTYHVGEDFRHILSGLRHIDEVIEHFGFMSGDRLGHAVALGIDAKKLIGVNKIVCIPIMEHLENLLWIWGVSHDNGLNISTYDIEYKILKLAKKIYNEDFYNINVFMLREAYEKKFRNISDKQEILIKTCFSKIVEQDKTSIKHFCMINKANDDDDLHWDSDKLACTHFCPCYVKLYNKPIFVEITKADVELIENLQKMLIKKIENIGVYVETNPTSNTAIADIDSIMSHPILRLNNPGMFDATETSVLVTINSDDPNVFSTNVENELALIYQSMLYFGCSREKALLWINKIREHGINSSFIKTIQNVKSIKEDRETLKEILKIV